jgi:hypothetical protein
LSVSSRSSRRFTYLWKLGPHQHAPLPENKYEHSKLTYFWIEEIENWKQKKQQETILNDNNVLFCHRQVQENPSFFITNIKCYSLLWFNV